MKKNKNKGITLIALVISIIVLLILAGVAIASLTGDNGLLNRTGKTNENTIKAQAQEELQLEIMGLKIEEAQKNNTTFIDYILSCEKYLQSKLNTSDLHIDKENKKISYKGNIFSVDDNGRLTLDEKGIILSTNNLDIQILGETKYEKTIEAIPINLEGDINWKTADETIAKVENGKIIPVEEGETIITATCANENEYKSCCRVRVEKFIDDSYVQYDVEYDDVYSGKRYTRNTGWRLITQKQNEDGTYNIEFISTGIPVTLKHYAYGIKSSVWCPTIEQVDEFTNKYYNMTSRKNGTYDAAGLYYNFEKIIFKEQTNDEYMKGYYKKIYRKNSNNIMQEINGDITGKIFKIKEDSIIRNVTLADIRGYDELNGKDTEAITSYNSGDEYADKKQGLFKLNDYYLDSHKNNYHLANPSGMGSGSSYYHVLGVSYKGSLMNSNTGTTKGLRPVITMKNVNMEKDGCVWVIK